MSDSQEISAGLASTFDCRRTLRIGSIVIDPPLLMAPMAGFTDHAFRQIVRILGGCGLPATEMLSARGMEYLRARGRDVPPRLWGVIDEPRPLAVQIWDNCPSTVAAVGRRLAREFQATIVDLNFGCPVADIAEKAESGAYLLRDPARVGEIVARVVAACAPTPVTAKIRLGVSRNAINAGEVAQAVEEAGGAAVAVHGRTAEDMYRGAADWDQIARIKPFLRSIPLIGNGDLQTAAQAVHALRTYPVDGVMIGRAAVGRPWIFRQAAHLLCASTAVAGANDAASPLLGQTGAEPDVTERKQWIAAHFRAVLAQYGEHRAVVLMRRFAAAYAHGRPGARAFRSALADLRTADAFWQLVDEHFSPS